MDNLFNQSILFDIYGDLLDEKQKMIYEYHNSFDLSFNEIGEELNLSRQAAYDIYNRADKKLKFFEEKLQLLKRLKSIENIANEIIDNTDDSNIKKLSKKIIFMLIWREKMAVKIRLRKMGRTHKSFYRIVVADSRFPRDGRFIEEIGYYNPYKEPSEIKLNKQACKKWLSTGAKPTDTVAKLLKIVGITK